MYLQIIYSLPTYQPNWRQSFTIKYLSLNETKSLKGSILGSLFFLDYIDDAQNVLESTKSDMDINTLAECCCSTGKIPLS